MTIALVFTFLSSASGQEYDPSEQKHIIIAPQNTNRSVQMEAHSVERGLPYPSVVTLKGNVSIKTPVCLPIGKKSSIICDGYMIVHADEAQLDEKTGEIRAQGNVVVTPIYHEKKK
jgi:hypothetical protein